MTELDETIACGLTISRPRSGMRFRRTLSEPLLPLVLCAAVVGVFLILGVAAHAAAWFAAATIAGYSLSGST
jgi:hypothetical protein